MGENQQRLCLRWNKFPGIMALALENLQDQREFVDVTLACRGGKVFAAHKVVLSACSPYFRHLLKSNPCQHPIIFMKDVRPEEMEALIQFMYHGQTSIDQNKLAVLLQAAEALQIKGLADVSGLSYDDLERGDVGSTETATCTQMTSVRPCDKNASVSTDKTVTGANGGRGGSNRKTVPANSQRAENVFGQKRGELPSGGRSTPQPPAKKRKQLPVLQSILGNENEESQREELPAVVPANMADLTPEPKDYSVNGRAQGIPQHDHRLKENPDGGSVEDFNRAGNVDEPMDARAEAEKENIDSNVPSVKSELDMDDYDDELDGGDDDGRYLATNMVEISGSPEDYHDDVGTGGRSPLLPIDPASIASGDLALSAAAKLQEVASRVSSASAGSDPQQIGSILASPLLADVSSGGSSSLSTNGSSALSIGNGDSGTPRKLAFHEPRPCPVCKRVYRDAATLRTHTAIMHTEGTTPFFCSCGSPFRTKYEMYVHKKNGHKQTGAGGSALPTGLDSSLF